MGHKVKIINFQPIPLVLERLKLSDILLKRYIPREQPLAQIFLQALGAQINAIFIRNEVKQKKIISNFYEEVSNGSLLRKKVITILSALEQECSKYDICLVGCLESRLSAKVEFCILATFQA
jgi:hypothetical protein